MEFTTTDILYKSGEREIQKVVLNGKIMCAKIGTDVDNLRFEYQTLKSLHRFKCILRVFDFKEYTDNITKSNKAAILIEFCSNGNLAQYIQARRKKNLPMLESTIWKHLKEFNMILRHLQQIGKSHRDIKPDNIFVNENEELRLGDFGEGKNLEENQLHSLRGTPLYLSPILEKVYEKNFYPGWLHIKHNIYKSDVFSFGLTILYMLSMDYIYNNDRKTYINEKINMIKSAVLRILVKKMLEYEEIDRFDFENLGIQIEFVSSGKICWACAENADLDMLNCYYCVISFHKSCANRIGSSHFCDCGVELDHVEIEILDSLGSNFELSCRKECIYCYGKILELGTKYKCQSCDTYLCKKCKFDHSDKINCFKQENFKFNCKCNNWRYCIPSQLFYNCEDCGIICCVCNEKDISRSHLACAQTLKLPILN